MHVLIACAISRWTTTWGATFPAFFQLCDHLIRPIDTSFYFRPPDPCPTFRAVLESATVPANEGKSDQATSTLNRCSTSFSRPNLQPASFRCWLNRRAARWASLSARCLVCSLHGSSLERMSTLAQKLSNF